MLEGGASTLLAWSCRRAAGLSPVPAPGLPDRQARVGLDLLNFFVANLQTAFGPFVSVYLTTQAWTQGQIGLALSIGTVASMTSQIPAGALVDHLASKRGAAAAAIVAVIHDVLITLGAVAVTYWLSRIPGISEALLLEPFKIDLPMIAAFLTLIGFSVNDTIVIFDRIREIKGKTPHLTGKMINDALNQTLSRTILTSLTAWLVVVVLYVLGGEGLHGFAFSLVVGFLSGTYSTIYIASPILIDWDRSASEPPAKVKELVASR